MEKHVFTAALPKDLISDGEAQSEAAQADDSPGAGGALGAARSLPRDEAEAREEQEVPPQMEPVRRKTACPLGTLLIAAKQAPGQPRRCRHWEFTPFDAKQ